MAEEPPLLPDAGTEKVPEVINEEDHEKPILVIDQPTITQPPPSSTAQSDLKPPHSFLVMSIITSVLCGVCNVLTLPCSIPAVILSVLSLHRAGKGDYTEAKMFGNIAAFLNVSAILCELFVLTGGLVGAAATLLWFNYCGFDSASIYYTCTGP